MGRNAAFGRPPAPERFRMWWDARSKTSRQNGLLAVVVGGLFVAIVLAAVARDKSPSSSRVISTQPTTTLALPTPMTVDIAGLGGAAPPADLFGSTTTSAPEPATTVPAAVPPAARPAPVGTTAPPAPATTVTNPDAIFSTVPPDMTTTSRPPATTTTRPPTTTTTRATTTTVFMPLGVANVLDP